MRRGKEKEGRKSLLYVHHAPATLWNIELSVAALKGGVKEQLVSSGRTEKEVGKY